MCLSEPVSFIAGGVLLAGGLYAGSVAKFNRD